MNNLLFLHPTKQDFGFIHHYSQNCVILRFKSNNMARIMAIDLGRKRCGIAVSDPLQIIANGLTTIPSSQVVDFMLNYLKQEEVETLVIGEPKDMNNNPSDCSKYIDPIVNRLKKLLPTMNIVRYDERFTSVMAHQTMIDAGLKKSKRQDKELVDTIAATIILQSYMESIRVRREEVGARSNFTILHTPNSTLLTLHSQLTDN